MGELSKLDVGGGAVGVEDVVVGVECYSLGVKGYGSLEVTGLARGVALPHLLQKESLRPAALSLTINLQLWEGKALENAENYSRDTKWKKHDRERSQPRTVGRKNTRKCR